MADRKIAIVILNFNGAGLFGKYLPSVIRHSADVGAELFVADNGSTDNSVQVLKTDFPGCKIIELKKNHGFAEGYNLALQEIEADFFILLNSDVEVTAGWIENAMQLFDSNQKIAAVQPKILSHERPHLFEYAGAAGGFIDRYGYPFCRGRIMNRVEDDNGQYNTARPVFWASGACMFVKADAFRTAGGFDGTFWAHMEEIDLCWRMKSRGHEIWCQPESVVLHLGGGTLSYGSPRKMYLNFRNNLFMLFKNLPRRRFKRILFARMVLDGVAAVKFLAGLQFYGFWAVVKAHVSFYRCLPLLVKKRKTTQASVTVKEHREIYGKNIMWKFFIQKKRKFSELNL